MRPAPAIVALGALLLAAGCGGDGGLTPDAPPWVQVQALAAQGDADATVRSNKGFLYGRTFK